MIELIVVIAILGILALIAVPRFAGIQHRSEIKADISNAEIIGNAAEAALVEGAIPPSGTTTISAVLLGTAAGANGVTSSYLTTWPVPKATVTGVSGDFTVTIGTGDIIYVTRGAFTAAGADNVLYPVASANYK